MSNIAVIYKSKYGQTEKYAKMLAKQCEATLFDFSQADQALQYDIIVVGGSIIAGRLTTEKLVKKLAQSGKKVIAFGVGFALPDQKQTDQVKEANKINVPFFLLRGGYDFARLNFFERMIIGIVTSAIRSKPQDSQTALDSALIAAYNGRTALDLCDESSIAPIVEQVRAI